MKKGFFYSILAQSVTIWIIAP